ncbi:MAG TPA: DUF4213 domain-containing protein [Candidatus Ventrimonas merdavium]|nr:DUF4213 domain-containing protein [Candidatus Ventrimonas merdavium]
MKRYMICLFLFVAASTVCLGLGFMARREQVRSQEETAAEILSEEQTEASEGVAAANQEQVAHENREEVQEEFYLVSEDGFLLVFLKDQETICLYTHVPLADFPKEEQEKLREGIWFPSMMEVFQYLESYTS